jgi:TPR repeat protein
MNHPNARPSVAGQRLFVIAAFLLTIGSVLPNAYAQDSDAERAQFLELKIQGERGDAEAQYSVGIRYFAGIGVEKDEQEAMKWYRKAAEQNLAKAQYALTFRYYHGSGVEKDYKEAAHWCRKAADQNYPSALYQLGIFYAKGAGVSKDEKEAVSWYRKAGEQSLTRAQSMLGWCYANGVGVDTDFSEAYAWYSLAAEELLKLGSGGDKGVQDVEMQVKRHREALLDKMSPQQLLDAKLRQGALQKLIAAKKTNSPK